MQFHVISSVCINKKTTNELLINPANGFKQNIINFGHKNSIAGIVHKATHSGNNHCTASYAKILRLSFWFAV